MVLLVDDASEADARGEGGGHKVVEFVLEEEIDITGFVYLKLS